MDAYRSDNFSCSPTTTQLIPMAVDRFSTVERHHIHSGRDCMQLLIICVSLWVRLSQPATRLPRHTSYDSWNCDMNRSTLGVGAQTRLLTLPTEQCKQGFSDDAVDRGAIVRSMLSWRHSGLSQAFRRSDHAQLRVIGMASALTSGDPSACSMPCTLTSKQANLAGL